VTNNKISRIAQKKLHNRLLREHEQVWREIRQCFEECLEFESRLDPAVNMDEVVKDLIAYCGVKGYRTSQAVVGFIESVHALFRYAKMEMEKLKNDSNFNQDQA